MSANSAIFNPTESTSAATGNGFSVPRLTTTGRLAITFGTGDKGMMVYDTTLNNLFIWNGSAWESVPASGDAGANGSVQYNDNGVVSGAVNFVWDSANNRVGVLTATPRAGFALDVLGNVALGDSTTTTSNRLKLDCSGTAGNVAVMSFAAAGTNKVFYGLSGGFLGDTSTDALVATDAAGAAIRFFTSNTGVEAGRLNSTGNLILKGGTVGANGVGVTFPATQVASSDANTLDDYEEGTFTPAVTGSTTAGTATYVGRSGKYTKIGNLVQVQIFIDYNSHTGTGDTRITGLPFTNGANFSAASVGYANGLALTAGNYVQAYVDASQSFILLNQAPTGGGSNTTVPIDPAATLVITATYTI